jgi:hypothetical protein
MQKVIKENLKKQLVQSLVKGIMDITIVGTIMEMARAKEMGNINAKEALGSLFFL